MKIPNTNQDLRKYVRKKRFLRLLPFFLWMLLGTVGIVSYQHRNTSFANPTPLGGWKLPILLGILTLSGCFLFRLFPLLRDRTCSGTVISSKLRHDYSASEDPGVTSSVQYDFRVKMSVCIVDTKSKKHRIRFEQKDGFYAYYEVGTQLVHFSGLPYPIRTDENNGYLCVACGTVHPMFSNTCEQCGHSLIHPKDLPHPKNSH